jgi:hypothetical protein
MPVGLPAPQVPGVTSVAGAMYLDVTRQVNAQIDQGFYADPAFMTGLDVTFANLYFDAIGVAADPAAALAETGTGDLSPVSEIAVRIG